MPDHSPPLTIYKIGGSLLDMPELPQIIQRVLAQRPGQAALLVSGGGEVANVVRKWDRLHHLGDDTAHALALKAMDISASLLAHFLPGARLVRSPRQVRMAAQDGVISLLCADCFVKAAEAQGHAPLEHTWRVTSDSIAAWTAEVLRASELVLIKSISAPCGMDAATAARAGFVDEYFPSAAAGLSSIGWVNGRAREPMIETWQKRV